MKTNPNSQRKQTFRGKEFLIKKERKIAPILPGTDKTVSDRRQLLTGITDNLSICALTTCFLRGVKEIQEAMPLLQDDNGKSTNISSDSCVDAVETTFLLREWLDWIIDSTFLNT